MADQQENDLAVSDDAHYPSQTVRGIATLFIIFHLFSLFVAVTTALPTSNLLYKLRHTPNKAYVQALVLDTSYRFAHVTGDEDDADVRLQADIVLKSGEQKQITLPQDQTNCPEGRQRLAKLIRLTSTDSDEFQGIVGAALASGLLKQLRHDGIEGEEIEKLTMTVQRRANQVEVAKPVYRPIYSALVSPAPEGPPGIIKLSDQGESAPAASQQPNNQQSPSQQSPSQPSPNQSDESN